MRHSQRLIGVMQLLLEAAGELCFGLAASDDLLQFEELFIGGLSRSYQLGSEGLQLSKLMCASEGTEPGQGQGQCER